MKLARKSPRLLDPTDQFLDVFRRRFHPGMIFTFGDGTLHADPTQGSPTRHRRATVPDRRHGAYRVRLNDLLCQGGM